jgi:hypothetical protein
MRYMTVPRWVYIMLIVMGIGFAAGAVPFWLFVPVSGHLVAVIWFLMGAGFVFFSLRTLAGRRDDELIRREGARATATVLSANATGWLTNNVPQWKITLRIDGTGASYETAIKLNTYGPPNDGDVFTVRVDPRNKQHVVLAGDDDDAPAPRSTPAGITPDVAGTASPGVTVVDARGTEIGKAVLDALRRGGGGGTATTTVASDAAETVKLLAELDRMHASGIDHHAGPLDVQLFATRLKAHGGAGESGFKTHFVGNYAFNGGDVGPVAFPGNGVAIHVEAHGDGVGQLARKGLSADAKRSVEHEALDSVDRKLQPGGYEVDGIP